MNRVAVVFAWVALLIGFPQVLIGMLAFYAGGWWLVGALALVLMPFAPIIARMHPRLKGRAAGAAVALSVVSLALNVAVYWMIYRDFTLD